MKTGYSLILGLLILSGGATFADAPDLVVTQVPYLLTSSVDANGNFSYSYKSCDGHSSRVEIGVAPDDGRGPLSDSPEIRVRVYDVASSRGGCDEKIILEGSANLPQLIQQAADLKGATIRKHHIPVRLPPVGVPN